MFKLLDFVKKYRNVIFCLTVVMVGVIYAAIPTRAAIITVDVNGIIKQYVNSLKALSTEEQRKRISLFSTVLERDLNALAERHQAVLLPSEAVIAGGQEVTAELTRQLAMQGYR